MMERYYSNLYYGDILYSTSCEIMNDGNEISAVLVTDRSIYVYDINDPVTLGIEDIINEKGKVSIPILITDNNYNVSTTYYTPKDKDTIQYTDRSINTLVKFTMINRHIDNVEIDPYCNFSVSKFAYNDIDPTKTIRTISAIYRICDDLDESVLVQLIGFDNGKYNVIIETQLRQDIDQVSSSCTYEFYQVDKDDARVGFILDAAIIPKYNIFKDSIDIPESKLYDVINTCKADRVIMTASKDNNHLKYARIDNETSCSMDGVNYEVPSAMAELEHVIMMYKESVDDLYNILLNTKER